MTTSATAAPVLAAGAASTTRASRVRYGILAMLFLVTTINYADRATLSITGPALREEFGFDAVQMGYIFSAFSWAYVMAQIPGGWMLDRYGARRVYGVSILLWSVFTMLQATVGVTGSFISAMAALFAWAWPSRPRSRPTRKWSPAGSPPANAARRRRSSTRRSTSPRWCSRR